MSESGFGGGFLRFFLVVCGFVLLFFLSFCGLRGRAHWAAQRNCQKADVADFQPRECGVDVGGRRGVETGGEKDDCFFALGLGEQVEDGAETFGEIETAEADVVADVGESGVGGGFVGSEVEHELGSGIVFRDGDAVAGGEAF